jgi:hypothetical protein
VITLKEKRGDFNDAFKEWRAGGLAENYVQPDYDMDLETISWPDV